MPPRQASDAHYPRPPAQSTGEAPARAGGAARDGRSLFGDLRRWLAVHDLLTSLDPAAAPTARVLPADWPAPERLAVLAGSFNPLTRAHTALAQQALRHGDVTAVAYALSVRTVNKEQVTGAGLEDRVLTLVEHLTRHPTQGIVLLNRGLYVDQALALRALFPDLAELAFIVGYDKLLQIFDPRYYHDRDTALAHLFTLASLLVAPRDAQGRAAVAALLDQPENRRFAASVRWLPLADRYTHLSSTQVRQAVSHDQVGEAVPAATRALLLATRVYAPPRHLASGETIDAYALRQTLLRILAETRPWSEQSANLTRLLHLTRAPGRAGQQFRSWLERPPADPLTRAAALADFQGR